MVGRVRVDVLDGGGSGGDSLDGEDKLEELGVVVFGSRGLDESREGGVVRNRGVGGEGGEGGGITSEFDVGREESRGEFRPESREESFVDEEGFGRVAGGGVGGLSREV